MNLESAIDHIKNEAMPKAEEGTQKTWAQILEWLEELKWIHDGRPFPSEVREAYTQLCALHEVLETTVTKPKHINGCYWIDLIGDHKSATVEYNRTRGGKTPWEVSITAGMKAVDEDVTGGFGQGPDNIFATIPEMIEHVKALKIGEQDPAYGQD